MPSIRLEHLGKTFASGVHAVRDFTLEILDGEYLVLVGPSGSGKTTLLRLIAGLEIPTTGTIRIDGQVANSLPPRRRDVAFVFQRYNLYPHLTIRRNLTFGLEMQGSSWLWPFRNHSGKAPASPNSRSWESRVTEVAALLGLEGILERYPRQLSGGQQQRASLGKALVRRPGTYLLDEPLSHLDAGVRSEFRQLLHLLHHRFPATILHVTHDQLEAMTLGRRIAVLKEGVLQQVAAPATVYHRPVNRFVAGFIGWPAMNFLEGRLVRQAGDLAFCGGGWSMGLGPKWTQELGEYADRPVTVGIRPEHLEIGSRGADCGGLAMEVIQLELLGSDRLATLQHGAVQFKAKTAGQMVVAVGQMVEVFMPVDQIHLFDSTTGLALRTKGPEG